jgi:hypothetical protein
MDQVGAAEVRTLTGGTVVALMLGPGSTRTAVEVVCDELVPLAQDPSLAGHPELGLVVAEAGPGATGRCRAELEEWDGEGRWACARGHRNRPAYDEAEAFQMWVEEEAERRYYEEQERF